jgi:hypothetical protein
MGLLARLKMLESLYNQALLRIASLEARASALENSLTQKVNSAQ